MPDKKQTENPKTPARTPLLYSSCTAGSPVSKTLNPEARHDEQNAFHRCRQLPHSFTRTAPGPDVSPSGLPRLQPGSRSSPRAPPLSQRHLHETEECRSSSSRRSTRAGSRGRSTASNNRAGKLHREAKKTTYKGQEKRSFEVPTSIAASFTRQAWEPSHPVATSSGCESENVTRCRRRRSLSFFDQVLRDLAAPLWVPRLQPGSRSSPRAPLLSQRHLHETEECRRRERDLVEKYSVIAVQKASNNRARKLHREAKKTTYNGQEKRSFEVPTSISPSGRQRSRERSSRIPGAEDGVH